MKTNLDSLFKTDSKLETEGVEFRIGDISFVMKRMGGENAINVQKSMAKFYKPLAKLIEAEKLPQKEVRAVMAKVFADSCLISWTGVKNDKGEEIDCNFQNAVDLFTGLPELFDTLVQHAQKPDNFREDLGNF